MVIIVLRLLCYYANSLVLSLNYDFILFFVGQSFISCVSVLYRAKIPRIAIPKQFCIIS